MPRVSLNDLLFIQGARLVLLSQTITTLNVGYDALLLEYHGIEYPDLPEAPEKSISAFRPNSFNPTRHSFWDPRQGGNKGETYSQSVMGDVYRASKFYPFHRYAGQPY
ncbi:hypothetical protein L6452_30549 [Arctium lappa]|uniref:Uncharacterized protein n=1 Tax=Arctium lappa TaxID=4217 RepID=A0ACB8ZJ05_ARCLA|nr:hypothetical protein L6452_30549 [Arctium lappa]